jgi:ferritin-like metal-binding protein YciE
MRFAVSNDARFRDAAGGAAVPYRQGQADVPPSYPRFQEEHGPGWPVNQTSATRTLPRSARHYQGGAICSTKRKRNPAMGLFTKDIKTMNDLFVHQLQDIYYAEKQLTKALPKMAEKATDKELKQGFLKHLDETNVHVQRLEQVFQMHGAEIKAVTCPAIDGIIKEADETAGDVADRQVLDAALINAAQAAEHYEIARYGSLIAWAKQLGRNDCAAILQKTLDEEKATDKKLTALAEGKVNLKAAS